MKIDRIELFHVAMPLIYPWRTAYGEDAEVHSVLCRLTSGSVDAWGEASPLAAPCYSPEWAGGVFATVRDWLAPAIVGTDVPSGTDLQHRLSIFKANPFAKAVLDTAWWALHCRLENRPLHVALGAARDRVSVGADFGVLDNLDDLLADVGRAVSTGFPRIKLKFRPGWDIPILEAVRKNFPLQPFHIDCNGGYRLRDAEMFRRIDAFQLAMIEQPLQHDDLLDHSRLQGQIKTAVCLDESISHPRHAEQAIELGSCRFINVKLGRVGGLTNAALIHDICRDAGIPCWVGGMLESSVGASMCVALAMLENFVYPADIFPSSRFYNEDLGDRPIELSRCPEGVPQVAAFDDLPVPNQQRLEKCLVQSARI